MGFPWRSYSFSPFNLFGTHIAISGNPVVSRCRNNLATVIILKLTLVEIPKFDVKILKVSVSFKHVGISLFGCHFCRWLLRSPIDNFRASCGRNLRFFVDFRWRLSHFRPIINFIHRKIWRHTCFWRPFCHFRSSFVVEIIQEDCLCDHHGPFSQVCSWKKLSFWTRKVGPKKPL